MKYKVPLFPVLFFSIFAIVGLWNLTREERINFRSYVQHQEFTDKNIALLSQGVTVSAEFRATESQLGIISFRFQKPDSQTASSVVFRIKEKGRSAWYYEHEYTANQLHENNWYPFGFPILEQSRGKVYQMEIEGSSVSKEDAVLLLANRGFLVQHQVPNERLFAPIHRVFLLFQNNVISTVKAEIFLYVGFIVGLFYFTFILKKISVYAKTIFMIEIFLFVMFLQPNLYQSVQISTLCFIIITIYSLVFQKVLNGTRMLIISALVFTVMSVYYVFGEIAIAERLAEWVYSIIILSLLFILPEIHTRVPKKRGNKIQ
ncbi:MAG: hypothetical protein WCT36_04725 [Candidatus Gracilibacteria bacterium]